ncbi:HNH endonuclease family protein [Streptomyces sp. NPDC000594]|uniref:HNH endonuclease family protein n=1 Tax=Streptomyces sp. NPDC000594 TaxID=3154261 RepID=UPI003328D9BF
MITTFRRCAVAATLLALLPLPTTVAHAAAPAEASSAEAVETAPLTVAAAQLPVADENRTGYDRDLFRHWNAGLIPSDGCNTRNEILIAEAAAPPAVGARCALTGGLWWSYYDEVSVTPASSLDIDHMVPLAEAWDSGAHSWTAARRAAYANDQGQASSLVAVTARSNRAKADQDPAQWLPPAPSALCRYLSEWTATKLRWGLTADSSERNQLITLATDRCSGTNVTWTPAR